MKNSQQLKDSTAARFLPADTPPITIFVASMFIYSLPELVYSISRIRHGRSVHPGTGSLFCLESFAGIMLETWLPQSQAFLASDLPGIKSLGVFLIRRNSLSLGVDALPITFRVLHHVSTDKDFKHTQYPINFHSTCTQCRTP